MECDERQEGVLKPSQMRQMKDFLPKSAMLTSQALHAISDAPPVDVTEYNYALIYHIVLLSKLEFLSVPREGCSPPPLPVPLTHPLPLFSPLWHMQMSISVYLRGPPAAGSLM